jgi:hypothetical protein
VKLGRAGALNLLNLDSGKLKHIRDQKAGVVHESHNTVLESIQWNEVGSSLKRLSSYHHEDHLILSIQHHLSFTHTLLLESLGVLPYEVYFKKV